MRVSPFAFFRGAAVLMASDLATLPRTGLNVQLCGDAHVHNLGAYAAPDGQLVFDINDFDETLPGPVGMGSEAPRHQPGARRAGKRGQAAVRCEDEAVRAMVASYREHLREFALMPFVAARPPSHHAPAGRTAARRHLPRPRRRITPASNLKN